MRLLKNNIVRLGLLAGTAAILVSMVYAYPIKVVAVCPPWWDPQTNSMNESETVPVICDSSRSISGSCDCSMMLDSDGNVISVDCQPDVYCDDCLCDGCARA